MDQKETLKCLDHYSHKFQYKSFGLTYIINNVNIDILKNILSKCSNIKQFDLSNTEVTGNNHLLAIANKCLKLEAIYLNCSKIDVSIHEMDEFAKIIGPQLIKCSFIYYSNLMDILIKKMKNIEDIRFESYAIEQDKQLFHNLNNECKNLKVFHCNYFREHFDCQDEDVQFFA